MDFAEKLLKELETPEGQAKIDKWVQEYIAQEEAKKQQIRSMMSNLTYLKWLNQFMQNKESFSDDDWLYSPEQITDSDWKKVDILGLFYEGINNYAKLNYIYPYQCPNGNYYKIRLNDKGFEIGVMAGQGIIFFCKKVPVENEQEFIDFNDIMIGKKQEQVDRINESLENLSNMVLKVYESGVPIESITYTLENTIKEITSKKEGKSRLLQK